jgi:hypothetical protein
MTLARTLDAHAVKFPVAMIEEAERADPRWYAALFACSIAYSEVPSADVLDNYQPALDATALLLA